MAANDVPCCRPMFWVYLIICATLVVFAGLMSGLTLGLMSISRIDLEVLVNAGQPQERKNAAKILPVMKNQHLLLCTLLICNAMAMEALPIFLDALLPAWGAILISVTLILAFGEIIPQAICSRYGLSVGAKMVGIVRVLMLVFFPISYPISKLLDWLLGKGHFVLFRRAELKSLVNLHAYEAGKGGELTHDETTIIAGALDLTQKTAKDAMTPVSKAFSLDINSKLDMDTMGLIITKGHSRVPIYSGRPTNIIGIILVKNLITCRPEDEIPVGNVTIRKIPRVPENMPLYEILNEFQKGHSHMAVVVKGWKDAKLTMENAKGKSGMLEKKMKLNKNQIEVEEKGSDSHSNLDKELNPAARASPLHNNVINTWRPTLMNTMEQEENCKQLRKLEHGGESIVDVDSNLPSYSSEDEVIGIITMEDVIEELLQEEIYDETDEYVELHNKIRINMLSPRRSSPRSPRIASVPHLAWRTPAASPISPYHHTSILRSPVSPYVLAPGPRPTLSSSPGKCSPNSPAKLTGLGRKSPTSSPNSPANLTSLGPKSPTSHQVSRKPYEKLQKFDVV